jgi:hypothetical protein
MRTVSLANFSPVPNASTFGVFMLEGSEQPEYYNRDKRAKVYLNTL